jgi:hypothetical protein
MTGLIAPAPHPMKKFLLAPFLAALALFVWGFVYYGISGLPYRAAATTPDDAATMQTLAATFPTTGTYIMPSPQLMMSDEKKFGDLMQHGPLATVHILKEGRPPMSGAQMLKGFLLGWTSCLLLALLLHKSSPALPSYACRFMFSLTTGVLIALYGNLGEVIWWNQPVGWHIATLIYDIVGWAVAGAILARFYAAAPAAPA